MNKFVKFEMGDNIAVLKSIRHLKQVLTIQ